MRGTTVKNLNRFVDILILNTPPDQLSKNRDELIKEVKHFWYKSPQAKKFIHKVISGEIEGACKLAGEK
jgi:hypothetical protein